MNTDDELITRLYVDSTCTWSIARGTPSELSNIKLVNDGNFMVDGKYLSSLVSCDPDIKIGDITIKSILSFEKFPSFITENHIDVQAISAIIYRDLYDGPFSIDILDYDSFRREFESLTETLLKSLSL